MGQKPIGVVGQAPTIVYRRLCSGLLELNRTARAAPAGRDWTGATPPFLTAGAVSRVGGWGTRWGTGWGTHPPLLVGVAPVVFIPAGRLRTRHARRPISPAEARDA